jgi:hypothetical protein
MRNPDCLKYDDCLDIAADENLIFDCDGCDRKGLNRKPKEEVMVKICEVLGCDKKATNKGLCSTDFYRWKTGKIEHPRLGKFQGSGITPPKKNLDLRPGKIIEVVPDQDNVIFTLSNHLRNALKTVKTFADVLEIMDHGDQARLEINTYLHSYFGE